jgi:hypothetical protein
MGISESRSFAGAAIRAPTVTGLTKWICQAHPLNVLTWLLTWLLKWLPM